MRYSDDAFATIMLMSQVTPSREELVRPLTSAEYQALRERVRASELRFIGALTDLDMGGMMKYLSMTEREAYRICMLLNRVLPISISIEEFMNAGIGIMTIDDERYPESALEALQKKAPPMIYYAGRPEVFRQWSLGVFGNERMVGDVEERVRALVRRAVENDLVVVNDGTVGVGRIAEEEAFIRGGFSIEVLPGGMSERLKDERVMTLLAERQLLLLSLQHPDAPVTKPHALERNRLLYALSLASFVFSVRENSGNVWDGATEALKTLREKYLYAWDTPLYPGNGKLIERGARPFDGDEDRFSTMLDAWRSSVAEQISMFDRKPPKRH